MNYREIPDDPNRVGDEDYRPGDALQRRMDRDEANIDVDREWLQQQQEAAAQAAVDAGMYDYPEGSIIEDAKAVSLSDSLRQIVKAGYVDARNQPRSLWTDFNEQFGDGKLAAKLDRLGGTEPYYREGGR